MARRVFFVESLAAGGAARHGRIFVLLLLFVVDGWLQVRGSGQTPLPRSPIPAISSFVKSDLRVSEMQSTLTLHGKRAGRRVIALSFLREALASVSFGSVRQQLLMGLRPSLSGGAHYLDRIEGACNLSLFVPLLIFFAACGRRLSAEVERAFGALLRDVTAIAASPNCDPDSRLAALEVCGMRFRCFDASTLEGVGLLRALIAVVVETSPSEVALGVQPMELDDDKGKVARLTLFPRARAQVDQDDAVDAPPGAAAATAATSAAGVAKNDVKLDALRRAAWIAFRLLATQVYSFRSCSS